MAQYTIEDIEILRKKSGVTYEEAVNLLEYHNGSLARSLVDLEKNGRLKDGGPAYDKRSAKGVMDTLYRLRVKVLKKKRVIVNLSAPFMVILLLTAPHVVLIGLALCFLLGYRITGEKNSADFSFGSFEHLLKNAKDNVQSTVDSLSKQLEGHEKESANPPAPPRSDAPPSGTTPVNVQFPHGGSVDVREDDDGYHEADIE